MASDAWEQAVDPDSGQVYYFNPTTGETSWDPPLSDSPAVDDGDEWREAFDEASQTVYFYNPRTGETSWTRPSPVRHEDLAYLVFAVVRLQSLFRGRRARRRAARLAKAQHHVSTDPVTGQSLYTNNRTGTSSWTRPALFAYLGDDDENDDANAAEGNGDDDDDDEDFDDFQRQLEDDEEAAGAVRSAGAGADASDDEDGASESSVQRRRRSQPRSLAQQRVDAAEDLGDAATALDLSGLRAWRLSSRIWNLAGLRELSLARNELTRIPSGIQDLVHLETLDLSDNQLTRLPSCLQTTTTLTSLNAAKNQIADFSPRLWKLRGLRHLDLSRNALSQLPFVEGDLRLLRDTREWQVGIGLLGDLEFLDLSHNRLVAAPSSIEKCQALKHLDLSHNRIRALEEETLGGLVALRHLDLRHNQLEVLPETLSAMTSLERLLLDHNGLVALPEGIGNLQELEEFTFRENKVVQIPEEVGALGRLRHLALDRNPAVATLGVCFRFLPSITMLSARSCGLVAFESIEFLSKAPVQCLDLAQNSLMDFPVTVSRSVMKGTLDELILTHNALRTFPVEIVTAPCNRLRRLDLGHNHLRHVPPEIVRLRSLQELILSYNTLEDLPESLSRLPQLTLLYCDHNKLTTLPLGLGFLRTLRHLNAASNLLDTLPSSLIDLKDTLKSLHLNDNCLMTVPAATSFLPPSCFVDLSNNPFCEDAEERTKTPEVMYASALDCFHKGEYAEAEALLSSSLESIDTWPHIIRKQQHAPHLFLRGLTRMFMAQRAQEEVDAASTVVYACEKDVRESMLIRLRAQKRRLKTNRPDVNPITHPTKSECSNQLEEEDEAHHHRQQTLQDAGAQRLAARSVVDRLAVSAHEDLHEAITRKVPEAATAYFVKGKLEMRLMRFDEAVRSFTEVLQLTNAESRTTKDNQAAEPDPSTVPAISVPVYLQRAEAYRRLGQLPHALADLQWVLHHRPVGTDAVHTMAHTLTLEWAVQKVEFFVDHESLFRAFDVDSDSGYARRPEVHDLHVIRTEKEARERKTLTPVQRFNAKVEGLLSQKDAEAQQMRQRLQEGYDKRLRVLERTRAFKREIRENLQMELEEATQRAMEAELARLAELLRQELEREFHERLYMKYEDELTQWLASEERRLEAERRRREEDAKRKAEAKAVYETRLARRGGRRQQLASRGTGRQTTSTRRSPSPSSRGGNK